MYRKTQTDERNARMLFQILSVRVTSGDIRPSSLAFAADCAEIGITEDGHRLNNIYSYCGNRIFPVLGDISGIAELREAVAYVLELHGRLQDSGCFILYRGKPHIIWRGKASHLWESLAC